MSFDEEKHRAKETTGGPRAVVRLARAARESQVQSEPVHEQNEKELEASKPGSESNLRRGISRGSEARPQPALAPGWRSLCSASYETHSVHRRLCCSSRPCDPVRSLPSHPSSVPPRVVLTLRVTVHSDGPTRTSAFAFRLEESIGNKCTDHGTYSRLQRAVRHRFRPRVG